MRVLIVSQHFWPETFRINDVASSLCAEGCDVRVLTGKPNYPDGRIFPGYSMWGSLTETMDGILVHRVPLIPRKAGGALRLIANYLSFIAAAASYGPGLLGAWRPEVVLTYGTSPILQAIAAIRIARWTRARTIVWTQDLWPESLSATGFVHNPRVLAVVAHAVRWIYRRTDLVLVASEAFVAPVRALAGNTRVVVHPNPTAGTIDAAAGKGLALSPAFDIVFAGNFGAAQGLGVVLDAAERLGGLPDLRFVLVGSGRLDRWLRAEVARRGLHNVVFAGRFEAHEMPAILGQASALLVTLGADPVLALTLPSKLQSYLAAGRPILAALDGEGARVVRESGAGLVVPAENGEALADAVRVLYGLDPHARDAMGRAGQVYARKFDPARLTPILVDHLRAVLDPSSLRSATALR